MSAFPTRQSQYDFLAYYAALKEDDEEKGECLFNGEESGEEEEPAGMDEDLDELLDRSGAVDNDETQHKQLDAAHRAAEEKQLLAIAQRFEARAAAYADDAWGDVREGSQQQQQREISRRAKQARAAAFRARTEAEATRQAEEQAEKERAEGLKKRKHEALMALFEAYEAEGLSEATSPSAMPSTTAPEATDVKKAEVSGKKPRFRIAKKANAIAKD